MSQPEPPRPDVPPGRSILSSNGDARNLPAQFVQAPAAQPYRQVSLFESARRYHYVNALIVILAAINITLFVNFTAEDAFITYRYAENFVDTGSLVFNVGEPINAMTSPLHALLSAALYWLTGQTLISNKILGLLLLAASALLVWQKLRDYGQLRFLALGLMLMPPSVLLWTFGGLETPLLLFLVTATLVLADRTRQFDLRSLSIMFFVAGLAFLTRYDSILFLLPVFVHGSSKASGFKDVLFAMAAAAVLPLVWFATSAYYYGDLLPTSFYVKTPNPTLGSLFFNGIYIVSYLLFVGLIPTLSLAFLLRQSTHQLFSVLIAHFKRMWWLYLAIALELCYGLTMATHHMMFSFRFFVPYIPAAAILVVDLIRHVAETGKVNLSAPRVAPLLAGFLVTMFLFQLYQSVYTFGSSVNGITRVGEYRALGVRDYVTFIQTLEQEAHDIEQHWNTQNRQAERQPRILTYAAGILPYTFRDSYIYEKLVSYRHCFQRIQQGLYADYIHILAPRQGEVEQQLPLPKENYSLVSSYEMFFDGSRQWFLVYYNPNPEDHNLGPRIDFACRAAQ